MGGDPKVTGGSPIRPRPVVRPPKTAPLNQPPTGGPTATRRTDTLTLQGAPTQTIQPATDPQNGQRLTGITPLVPSAGMAIRREFNHIPLQPKNALQSYSHLTAHDFAGKDDIRLQQIYRTVNRENIQTQRELQAVMDQTGLTAKVGGRAKTPSSFYGKLHEPPKPGQPLPTVKDIKDASGLRIDVTPTKPGGVEFDQARKAVSDHYGSRFHTKNDYIRNPNPPEKGGYAGRIHDGISGENVANHELQIGSPDMGKGLIERKVTNAAGQSREIHDLTGYKGEVYGAKVSPELQQEYQALMGEVSKNSMAGKTLAQNPELKARVDAFAENVQMGLPTKFKELPSPNLTAATKLRNLAGKGMGVLGVAGGALQVYGGANEIRDGKTVEGSADIAGGTANVVAGGAMLAGRVALGTTAGGVAAVIDGGVGIYKGIRDHNVEEAAVGGVKTAAGAAMIAGVVTANPVLIVGGAVTYGAALVYENREAIKNAAVSTGKWIGNQAGNAAHALEGAGHKIAHFFGF